MRSFDAVTGPVGPAIESVVDVNLVPSNVSAEPVANAPVLEA